MTLTQVLLYLTFVQHLTKKSKKKSSLTLWVVWIFAESEAYMLKEKLEAVSYPQSLQLFLDTLLSWRCQLGSVEATFLH